MVVLDKNLVKAGDRVRYRPESDYYNMSMYAFNLGTVTEYRGSIFCDKKVNVRWDGFPNYGNDGGVHDCPLHALDWDKDHYVTEFIKKL